MPQIVTLEPIALHKSFRRYGANVASDSGHSLLLHSHRRNVATRNQSILTFASLTTFAHLVISLRMNVENSSGVLVRTSAP